MSNDLFTSDGQRKYVTAEERVRFLRATNAHECGEVRTLCLVMAYTGCRISEALQLTADRVDLSAKAITFRTLKQCGNLAYRAVPVPDSTLDAIELVHRIRKAQRAKDGGKDTPLWPWGPFTGIGAYFFRHEERGDFRASCDCERLEARLWGQSRHRYKKPAPCSEMAWPSLPRDDHHLYGCCRRGRTRTCR